MTEFRRKSWTIPDRVFDILADKPPEVEIEVVRAIRAYAHYWDGHRTDEGFDFDIMSTDAQRVFFRVYDDLKDANQSYYQKCAVLSENAQAGAKILKTKKRLKNRNKRYYEKNKKRILEKRRNSYQAKVCDDEEVREASEKTTEKRLKKTSRTSEKTTEESSELLENLGKAQNSAIAHRITGLNNTPSLHSEVLLERGYGGKPNYPQGGQDTAADVAGAESPTGSLSGSKAVQTGCLAPVCSKAVGAVKDAADAAAVGQYGNSGSKVAPLTGNAAVGNCSKAVGGGKMPPGSARNDCAAASAAKKQPKPWLSAPHEPGADEVRIAKNFKIDFTDPVFKPYAAADVTVRIGLESWLKKNKMGCSVEKKWLCKQIVTFSRNQGKLSVLAGVDPPG